MCEPAEPPRVYLTWKELWDLPPHAENQASHRRSRERRQNARGRWQWYVVESVLYEDPQHGHAMYRNVYRLAVIRLVRSDDHTEACNRS